MHSPIREYSVNINCASLLRRPRRMMDVAHLNSRYRSPHKAPSFVEPMKPLLVHLLPEGPEWSYEIKWDGYRALLWKHGSDVRLYSGNQNRLDRDFPSIIAAGNELSPNSCVLDGEIVALGQESPDYPKRTGSSSSHARCAARSTIGGFLMRCCFTTRITNRGWT